jgi:hypothetical protein
MQASAQRLLQGSGSRLQVFMLDLNSHAWKQRHVAVAGAPAVNYGTMRRMEAARGLQQSLVVASAGGTVQAAPVIEMFGLSDVNEAAFAAVLRHGGHAARAAGQQAAPAGCLSTRVMLPAEHSLQAEQPRAGCCHRFTCTVL